MPSCMGLRDQHGIERVVRRSWQCAGSLAVNERYRYRNQSLRVESSAQVRGDGRHTRQLAEAEPGSLPGGGGTEEHRCALGGDEAEVARLLCWRAAKTCPRVAARRRPRAWMAGSTTGSSPGDGPPGHDCRGGL